MDEYDDYGAYNGAPDHNMKVDYDYHQNSDELSEYFDNEDDEDDFDDDY